MKIILEKEDIERIIQELEKQGKIGFVTWVEINDIHFRVGYSMLDGRVEIESISCGRGDVLFVTDSFEKSLW